MTAAERAYFEPRFGHDFAGVRIHANERAARSAHELGARAYAVGSNVVFGRGQYSAESMAGRRLLAHELAHVVQQAGPGAAQGSGARLEQEADRAARLVGAGAPARVSVGVARAGTPQLDETAAHPEALPTPEEYIEDHKDFGGLNLQEAQLASDLYLLAWQSSAHYGFVISVFEALDSENQGEVAEAFFKQLKGDSWLKETALTPGGRSFLTSIVAHLPKKSTQRSRLEKIIAAGPQAEREKERIEALEELKERGGNVDITFYPEYEGMDAPEEVLGGIARRRLADKKTDAAFPMAQFDDIQIFLEAVSEKYGGVTDYVRELHLMGHGTKDNFGFGEYYYDSEYLRDNYPTGLNARYMANGGTIYMEGCNIAKGAAGRRYLREIGRIFFGDEKTGYIKGNTCTVFAIGELTDCRPRTFRWPGDFE